MSFIRLQHSTHNDALLFRKIILVSLQVYEITERVNVFDINILNYYCNWNSIPSLALETIFFLLY